METTPGGADESVRSVVYRPSFVFITVLFEYCLIKQKMHDKQNTALSSSYISGHITRWKYDESETQPSDLLAVHKMPPSVLIINLHLWALFICEMPWNVMSKTLLLRNTHAVDGLIFTY